MQVHALLCRHGSRSEGKGSKSGATRQGMLSAAARNASAQALAVPPEVGPCSIQTKNLLCLGFPSMRKQNYRMADPTPLSGFDQGLACPQSSWKATLLAAHLLLAVRQVVPHQVCGTCVLC